MDALILFMGALCLAEGIGLFGGKDFFMFTGSVKKEDYNLERVYRAERWVFLLDAACCLGVGINRFSDGAEWGLMAVFGATLFVHGYIFKSKKFRREG